MVIGCFGQLLFGVTIGCWAAFFIAILNNSTRSSSGRSFGGCSVFTVVSFTLMFDEEQIYRGIMMAIIFKIKIPLDLMWGIAVKISPLLKNFHIFSQTQKT